MPGWLDEIKNIPKNAVAASMKLKATTSKDIINNYKPNYNDNLAKIDNTGTGQPKIEYVDFPKPIVAPINKSQVLHRQAYKESSFNPKVISGEQVSSANAKGLTQIRDIALKEYIRQTGDSNIDLSKPEDAIKVQKVLMDSNLNSTWANNPQNKTDTVTYAKALIGYNYGSGNTVNALNKLKNSGVDIYSNTKWLDNPIIPEESRDYVNKILLHNVPKFENDYKAQGNKFKDLYGIKKNGGLLKYPEGGTPPQLLPNNYKVNHQNSTTVTPLKKDIPITSDTIINNYKPQLIQPSTIDQTNTPIKGTDPIYTESKWFHSTESTDNGPLSKKWWDRTLQPLPFNARQYGSTVATNGDGSYGKDDLPKGYLASAAQAINNSQLRLGEFKPYKPYNTEYIDYSKNINNTLQNFQGDKSDIFLNAYKDDLGAATTLGRFTFQKTAEGDYLVSDKYDFSKTKESDNSWGKFRGQVGDFSSIFGMGDKEVTDKNKVAFRINKDEYNKLLKYPTTKFKNGGWLDKL